MTATAMLAGLAVLLLAAGCDPELNEIEVGPRLPVVATYDGGSWQAFPALSAGRRQRCFAAWSPDKGVIGGDDGLILRWQGERLWNADFPLRADILSLAAHRPGVVYALTGAGSVYRCDGQEWARDRNADGGWGLSRLWCDHDGRVTAIGHHGRVLQRAGGVWSEAALGVVEWLYDIWGPGDGELWIVGQKGLVLHQEGGVWEAGRPFGAGEELVDVSGDAAGNVVIVGLIEENHYEDRARVHLRSAGAWRDLADPPPGSSGAVMVGGHPLVFASGGAFAWGGENWIALDGEPPASGIMGSLVALDGAVLGLTSGMDLVRWTAGRRETVSESLGWLYDVAVSAGDTLLMTDGGQVLRKRGLEWDREFEVHPYENWPVFLKGRGETLSLLVGDTMWDRVAGAWTPRPLPFSFSRAFTLDDGSRCLVRDGGLWLDGGSGGLRSLGTLAVDGVVCNPVAAAGPSAREFWFLDDKGRLGFCDGARLSQARPGGLEGIHALAWDPQAGLLLYGVSGLYALTDEGAQQITPRRDWARETDRYWVSDLLVLPDGDWLVWASPSWLYRRRGGVWDCPHGAGFTVVTDRQSNDQYGPMMFWRATPYLSAHAADAVLRVTRDALLVYRDSAGSPAGQAAGASWGE